MFVVPTCLPADPVSRQLITSSAVVTGCSVAPTITVKRQNMKLISPKDSHSTALRMQIIRT